MALTQNNQFTAIDFRYIRDYQALTGSAARSNAFGTSGKLYGIFVNNTASGADTGYLKLYDTNLAVTLGTTVPDFVFKIQANVREVFTFPEGLTFSSGFGYTISDNPGTTAGSAITAVEELIFTFK